VAERLPFWSDTFDLDLLAVVPHIEQLLGTGLAASTLWTHSHTTHGRINHPSAWNSYDGMVAYFGTRPSGFKPEACVTEAPLTSCTVLEALRDLWVHDLIMLVDGARVWQAPRGLLMPLLYHRRGWRLLEDRARDAMLARLHGSIGRAATTLRLILAAHASALPAPSEVS
jgi:hypothetical protein